MMISHNGSSVQLHGLQHALLEYSLIEVLVVSVLDQLPAPIHSLLNSFASLFEEPMDLPPNRSCNHNIPLIPSAQPVNIRPYRFSPAMKDEIEAQVQEMLSKGIIQHSHSAFSSHVLLVKKKDKTWRFYVDYRHMNVMTVKFKYLVPVICWMNFMGLHGFLVWI
jgi:hypothetical protein